MIAAPNKPVGTIKPGTSAEVGRNARGRSKAPAIANAQTDARAAARKLELLRERRSQLRGLLYLAAATLLFLIIRFGPHRVFTRYWWLP